MHLLTSHSLYYYRKKVNFQVSPRGGGGGGGGGGGNGFAKLQQLAKVRGGGPVVVSYESDEGEIQNR